MDMMMQEQMQEQPEDAGRGTDSVMAHMSLGEVVIPRAMLDDPEVMQALQAMFQQYEVDINEFTVGHEANKINPETGYPEFFFKKAFKLFKKVAPIAAAFIPGLQPLAAAALGAGLGAVSGGGLKGAIAGGLGGYAGAGGASSFGKALGMTTKAGATALGGGLLGAGAGAIQGGAKGALLGGTLGGVGGYAKGGGFDKLYKGSMLEDAYKGIGGGINSVYKGSLAEDAYNGIGNAIGGFGGGVAQGPSQIGQVRPEGYASGVLGELGKATEINNNSLTSLTGSAGGGSSFGSNMLGQGLSSGIGGIFNSKAIKDAEEAQLRAQQEQLANIDTFDPSNITSDSGYQFNLEQGQQGLNRSLAAAGGLQSGAALKAASEYNQKYADNALNSAYQRYANRVGAQNNIYNNRGSIQAQTGLAGAENIAKTASGIFNPQPSIEELLRLYGRA